MTVDEIRDEFIAAIQQYIDYWEKEPSVKTPRERLEGLAHSILVLLDGCSSDLPGFAIVPDAAPGDREYYQEIGENYYPCSEDPDWLKFDIGGGLHELFGLARARAQQEQRGP